MKNVAARTVIVLLLALGIFVTSPAYPFGHLTYPDETQTSDQCLIEGVSGQFSSAEATYTIKGTCYVYAKYVTGEQNSRNESTFDNLALQAKIPWSAVGTYNPVTKDTREQISLLKELPRARPDNPPLYQEVAKVVTTMICAVDPWLDQTFSTCLKVTPQISGDASVLNTNNKLVQIDNSYVVNVLYPPSVHVPRTSQMPPQPRAVLQKQYATAVAAAQRKGSEIRGASSQPGGIIGEAFFPSVLSPAQGQRFIAQNAIPIRLAAPQGWAATGYVVNVVINGYSCDLPVSGAQAQSSGGYTGFGAGKPPCFAAVAGSYRLRAQVSSPTKSGWSNWVDFTVAPPRVSVPAGVGKLVK